MSDVALSRGNWLERSIGALAKDISKLLTRNFDARVRELRGIRRVREIPQAAEAWRERWTWLGHLGDADFAADVDARSLTLRARLRPAE